MNHTELSVSLDYEADLNKQETNWSSAEWRFVETVVIVIVKFISWYELDHHWKSGGTGWLTCSNIGLLGDKHPRYGTRDSKPEPLVMCANV